MGNCKDQRKQNQIKNKGVNKKKVTSNDKGGGGRRKGIDKKRVKQVRRSEKKERPIRDQSINYD